MSELFWPRLKQEEKKNSDILVLGANALPVMYKEFSDVIYPTLIPDDWFKYRTVTFPNVQEYISALKFIDIDISSILSRINQTSTTMKIYMFGSAAFRPFCPWFIPGLLYHM